MLASSRKTLTAIATVSALAAGGATLAGAATSTTPSPPAATSERAPRPAALTGETADKVKAAALAKVPGGTFLRAAEGGPYGTKYHAHVRRSDGSDVVVLVDASFEATSVRTRPARGPGRRGGPGGPRHEALTGDTAAKVKAAALERVPGATVLRSEKGGHGATYRAHVRRSDGSEVVVLVNARGLIAGSPRAAATSAASGRAPAGGARARGRRAARSRRPSAASPRCARTRRSAPPRGAAARRWRSAATRCPRRG